MRGARALVVGILIGIATIAPARADTVYAYWSYWQGDAGTWKYATVGPATSPAVDGAVDGWRFTLGSDGRAAQPAPAPDFATVCAGVTAPAGSVRVAVIIDFGSASSAAPASRCAVVDAGLSRASALTSVASLRLKNGFVCAIDGAPESGCGDAVAAPSNNASPSPSATRSKPAAAADSSSSSTRVPTTHTTATPTPDATAAPSADSATPAIAPDASPSASTSSRTSTGVSGSPLATIVTILLGGIALALAMRNARLQRGGQ